MSPGPKLIQHTTNTHKTIDTEDTELKCLVQPDGTLVTEKKKTTEHEDIIDEDLPDNADNQSTGSREKILKHKVRIYFECTRNLHMTIICILGIITAISETKRRTRSGICV